MRIGSKMRVFRVTDYDIYVWLERWSPAIPLLFEFGEAMAKLDSRLAIVRFDGQSFKWSLKNITELLPQLVETFLEVRGNAKDVNAFSAVFDTQMDIDLVAIFRLLSDHTVRMSLANIRFNAEHVKREDAPLTYEQLLQLFRKFIARAEPEHGEIMRYPPLSET